MKYYIAIDGGGSKLIALLIDENFRLIAEGYGGSVNPNFAAKEVIAQSVSQCLGQLFENFVPPIIESVYITFVGEVEIALEAIKQYVPIKRIRELSEPELGLLAGRQIKDGILALSGTGSDVFYLKQGKIIDCVGGWGAIVCEEGSGYYIGKMGLNATIYELEQRGPQTLLTREVITALGGTTLRQGIHKLYQSKNEVKKIAALSRVVSEVAAQGDQVANEIIKRNAQYMVEQTIPLLRRYKSEETLPIVVAGGVWKCYGFFEAYKKELLDYDVNLSIHWPHFEPIMGHVIAAYEEQIGELSSGYLEALSKRYQQFIYKKPEWE